MQQTNKRTRLEWTKSYFNERKTSQVLFLSCTRFLAVKFLMFSFPIAKHHQFSDNLKKNRLLTVRVVEANKRVRVRVKLINGVTWVNFDRTFRSEAEIKHGKLSFTTDVYGHIKEPR